MTLEATTRDIAAPRHRQAADRTDTSSSALVLRWCVSQRHEYEGTSAHVKVRTVTECLRRLYALDKKLDEATGDKLTKKALLKAMKDHTLGVAELQGTFEVKK
jgi:phosphatidylethanolamine-binding protein (PEBP) family uncharacterized protein